MIQVENLTKSFGRQVLFDGISFRLNRKERVGLVGRNGHGKTTLFKMVVGEEQLESGSITIPKFYRIGYVRQHIEFTEDTVLKEGMTALNPQEKDHHWKVEKILAGLGFAEQDMHRNPLEFSGGFQVRLNLAKVLISEPDLLLLDEPTNYLDITSIRWIEQFLNLWRRELLLITHDRGFMDKVITHTLAIHRKKIRKISGNTGKLYLQIAQEEEVYEKTRLNDERRRKEVELFITRFRAKARLGNLVQSRIKTLEKMEKPDKLESIRGLDFSFRYKPFAGKQMMRVNSISFSYDKTNPIIRDFSMSIQTGDRIGIIGKNGKGKTTLLKLLAGLLPADQGEIIYNPNVCLGAYEQTNIQRLRDSRTVEEEILSSDAEMNRQQARNICGAMMFEGDNALKKISVLSGGEKSRVMLGKLIGMPVNILLLDEPTNHLDMESCDALIAALDEFKGTLILVTHNEMFLHALANRLVVFHNNAITVFEDGYARFLESGGWGDEESPLETTVSSEKLSKDAKVNRKELKRKRSEMIAERSRVIKPIEQKIAKTENAIEANEKQLNKFVEEMQTASQSGNGEMIANLSRSMHECQNEIDRLFDELESLTNSLKVPTEKFDRMLEE